MKHNMRFAFALSVASLLIPVARVNAQETKPAETTPPAVWVTSISLLPGEQSAVVTTAEGLLLRPGAVQRVQLSEPSKLEKLYDHSASAWAVASVPESNSIVSVDYKGQVLRADLANATTAVPVDLKTRWSRAITPVGDGKVLIGSEDGKVFVVVASNGTVEKTIEAHAAAINAIAISGDHKFIATGAGDGTVKLWNAADGVEIRSIKVSTAAVLSVRFSNDGSRLITGDADRRLNLYDTSSGALKMTLKILPDWVTSIVAVPNDDVIVAGTMNGSLFVYDLKSLKSVIEIKGPGSPIWTLVLKSDGSQVIAGTRKHGLHIVPASSWAESLATVRQEAASEQPPAPPSEG